MWGDEIENKIEAQQSNKCAAHKYISRLALERKDKVYKIKNIQDETSSPRCWHLILYLFCNSTSSVRLRHQLSPVFFSLMARVLCFIIRRSCVKIQPGHSDVKLSEMKTSYYDFCKAIAGQTIFLLANSLGPYSKMSQNWVTVSQDRDRGSVCGSVSTLLPLVRAWHWKKDILHISDVGGLQAEVEAPRLRRRGDTLRSQREDMAARHCPLQQVGSSLCLPELGIWGFAVLQWKKVTSGPVSL